MAWWRCVKCGDSFSSDRQATAHLCSATMLWPPAFVKTSN